VNGRRIGGWPVGGPVIDAWLIDEEQSGAMLTASATEYHVTNARPLT
jgi:hypothetical protein